MTITTVRPWKKTISYVRRPGGNPKAKLPPTSVSNNNSTIRQTDERSGTKRKKPLDLMAHPSAYGRRVRSNVDFLTETVYVRQKANTDFDAITSYAGDISHSGFVARDVNPVPDLLVQQALIKARLKLKDQDVNLGQALAERKLTASLVSENLGRIARSVINLRRGRLKQAVADLGISRNLYRDKDFFNMWLELQYGWKPLLSDIHGAVTALSDDEVARNGLARVTVAANASGGDVVHRSVSETTASGYVLFKWDEIESYKAHVSLTYEKSNPTLASAAQLGFTNPLSLAWELLPFSFVVDWALPIGDFFNQLDASLGWDFVSGSLSTTSRYRRTTPVFSHALSTPVVQAYGYASTTGRSMLFNRTVYSSEPYAVVPVPKSFDKFSSAQHVANAIALLAQAFV